MDNQTVTTLNHWYQTHPGKLLSRIENQYLKEVLNECFGYYLISTGHLTHAECLQHSRIPCRVLVDPDAEILKGMASLQAISEQLPIQSDTIDALILSHSLEFSADPHLVLREADRILIPEGNLIIFGFNPMSFWGLLRPFFKRSNRLPWSGCFIPPYRLKDWLGLLGFEVKLTRHFYYRPPLQRKKLMRRIKFLEKLGHFFNLPTSGGYLIVAEKRVSTFTPIKPLRRKKLFASPLSQPSAAERIQRKIKL